MFLDKIFIYSLMLNVWGTKNKHSYFRKMIIYLKIFVLMSLFIESGHIYLQTAKIIESVMAVPFKIVQGGTKDTKTLHPFPSNFNGDK